MVKSLVQLLRFVLIGIGGLVIDIAFYTGSIFVLGLTPQTAKKISSLSAITWSFVGNKFFTFGDKEKKIEQPIKFILLYSITYVLDFTVHDYVLALSGLKTVAFICGGIVSAGINFIGLKFFVFRRELQR